MEKKKIIKCVIDENMKLGVQAISLVEFPAIETNWVAMSDVKLSAVNEERRMLYGPALIPDKHILRIDQSTGEEFYIYFEKDTVYQCAHQFMIKNLQHNHTLEHKFALTGCTIVESWLVEGENDKSKQLGIDVPVGTWMVGSYVQDDDVWAQVKDGSVRGFSIEGIFDHMVTDLSDQSDDLFLRALIDALAEK
jgi:hypothetical protein